MINPGKRYYRCLSILLLWLGLSFGHVVQAAVSIDLVNRTWALVSLPASNPSGNSPATIFGSKLPVGSYGPGGTWIVYQYNPQTNNYTVAPVNEDLEAGRGYWVIQVTGADINIDLSMHTHPFDVKASTPCPTNSGCVEVPLPNTSDAYRYSLQGYPQINPQVFGATRIRAQNGACSNGCTPDEADEAGVLANVFFGYDGTAYQRITSASQLKAGQGFWAFRPVNVSSPSADWLIPTTESLKVAFTADQHIKPTSEDVLKLIAAEGTDLLLLQGDFGYVQNAASTWEQHLNTHLGADFPVLSVAGNHENFEWQIYQSLITNRINRIPDLQCSGNIGVKSTCNFRGLQVTQVAAGVFEVAGIPRQDGYPEYIEDTLSNSPSRWRICSWHKNQYLMQTGSKANDPGWGVYQACLNAGAIVATGHEHAYSRTHLMNNFETQSVVHTRSNLEIKPGQSFAFVSGLGGDSVRPQQITSYPWWASIYTSTQGATYGALFCTFSGLTADCYFKAVSGVQPDIFTLRSDVIPASQ